MDKKPGILLDAPADVVDAVKWAIEGAALDYASRARSTKYVEAHDFYRDCQLALIGIADLVAQRHPDSKPEPRGEAEPSCWCHDPDPSNPDSSCKACSPDSPTEAEPLEGT